MWQPRNTATAPATSAVDAEVPLIETTPPSTEVAAMSTPGALTSTHEPKLLPVVPVSCHRESCSQVPSVQLDAPTTNNFDFCPFDSGPG